MPVALCLCMKRSLPLALLALLTFSSLGLAQDTAPDDVNEDRLRVGIHAQAGILTPTGLAGGFVSLSTRKFSVMLGGGYALSAENGWRVGLGVARLFQLTQNNAVGIEAWGAIGSWTGIRGELFGTDSAGHWSAMPTGHLHISYEGRFAERIVFRMFLGAMTNFDVEPDEGTCSISCSRGPVVGVSSGMSLGVLL